jgi:hypothetical protein
MSPTNLRVTLTNGGVVFHPSHPPGGPTMMTLASYGDTATVFVTSEQAGQLAAALETLMTDPPVLDEAGIAAAVAETGIDLDRLTARVKDLLQRAKLRGPADAGLIVVGASTPTPGTSGEGG